MSPRRALIPFVLTIGAATALTSCAASSPDQAGEGSQLHVLTSFYPLQYLVEEIGGDLVTVGSLTPPGGEPHDVELSPRQVREVAEADVVVVLSGFQPSVDEAVEARQPAHLVDAAATEAVAAHLTEEEGEHADEEQQAGEDEHAGEEDEHGHGNDPHFWLDPTLLAAVGQDLAATLGEADPANADEFASRADALEAELTELDEAFTAGLADCERDVVVAAHEAYGFMAERYGFEQVGISGLDPDAEPSPARLREIGEVVDEHGVSTIFTEALVNPKVAETLADDLGVTTAVLDPVEAQVDEATDYRDAMENNLSALREALGCR